MYFVYILFSEKGNRYYIGQTDNIEARLEKHFSGHVTSTKPYLPWKFILKIDKESRSEAVILEKKLKNFNRKDLERFIKKYS